MFVIIVIVNGRVEGVMNGSQHDAEQEPARCAWVPQILRTRASCPRCFACPSACPSSLRKLDIAGTGRTVGSVLAGLANLDAEFGPDLITPRELLTGVAVRAPIRACAASPAALLSVLYHVSSATPSDVEDGGGVAVHPHLSVELLVEAEDCAFAGGVDVAYSSSAGLIGLGSVRVEGSGDWSDGG